MYSFQANAGRKKNKQLIRLLYLVIFILVIALIGVCVAYSRSTGVSEATSTALLARALSEATSAQSAVYRLTQSSGTNTMTLLSTDDIIEHIIPQYRKVVDLVHETGRPFLLHSCGNLFKVFDDIIEKAGIDAKHSNEDVIGHFSVWVDRYGDKIGNFGGIDTDVLCRQSPEYIREYILDCLGKVAGKGGIAFASGNSIPDYVPTEGYLAMIETVREWRGDRIAE